MDEDNLKGKSSPYNYDNCIVRDRDDENDYASSTFSLQLANNTDVEDSTEADVTKLKENDEPSDPLELTVNETLTLTIGFLIKLEKYFTTHISRSAKDADFREKVILVKKCIVRNSKHFGLKISENENESITVIGNVANNNEIDTHNGNKDNNENNETNTESTARECDAQDNKEDSENNQLTPHQGIKRKSKDAKNENFKPSCVKRRKAHLVACENEQPVNIATEAKCSKAINGFQSVVDNVKEATVKKTKREVRSRSRKLSKSSVTNDRNISRRSTSMKGLHRRSLFQPTVWLERFNQTYALPT